MGKCDSQFSTIEVTLDRHLIPYSGKFLLGANFRNFADRPASAKIKPQKNTPRWKLLISLHVYVDTN